MVRHRRGGGPYPSNNRVTLDGLRKYRRYAPEPAVDDIGPIIDGRCAAFLHTWSNMLRGGDGLSAYTLTNGPVFPQPPGVRSAEMVLCTPEDRRRWTDAVVEFVAETDAAAAELYAAIDYRPYVGPWSPLRLLRTGNGRPPPGSGFVTHIRQAEYTAAEQRYLSRLRVATAGYAPVRAELDRLVEEARDTRSREYSERWERVKAEAAAERVWLYVIPEPAADDTRTAFVYRRDVEPRDEPPEHASSHPRPHGPLTMGELDEALGAALHEGHIDAVTWDANTKEHVRTHTHYTLQAVWRSVLPNSAVFPPPPPPTPRTGSSYTGTGHHSSHGVGGHF